MKRIQWPIRFFSPRFLEWATSIYMPVGKRVIILGGQFQGIELAEFLMRRGREVIVTDTASELGGGLLYFHKHRVLDWLEKKGCRMLAGVTYDKITKQGLSLTTCDGEKQLIKGDTIVALSVRETDYSLRDKLAGLVPEIHVVGDCNEPGMIVDAVESGYRAACAI